jgi:hypothetical protein
VQFVLNIFEVILCEFFTAFHQSQFATPRKQGIWSITITSHRRMMIRRSTTLPAGFHMPSASKFPCIIPEETDVIKAANPEANSQRTMKSTKGKL